MNKTKIVKKSGISQLVIKSQKGQQLSEREIFAINNNEVAGLLYLDVEQRGAKFTLSYNITGFISLRRFLMKPLTKQTFAAILQNILLNLKSMQEAYFNQEYTLLDLNRVMVNPATEKIFFVFVPIQGFESGCSLRDFLLDIIQCCTFAPGEESGYVKDYITILNSGINFSVFELEQYINRLSGQGTDATEKVACPVCHSAVKKGTNYCGVCGNKISGNTGNIDGKGIYDPFDDSVHREQESSNDERINTEKPSNNEKNNTQGLSDETTVLGADPGGTTVLGSEKLEMPNYPYLIREKNEEKIPVNKPSFRIGKEKKYSDYFVSDNNAVSRSHADILTKNKRYYIIDLNSTNRTYVDGRAIPIEKEIEIFSGTKLRLANEDFVFYIETQMED